MLKQILILLFISCLFLKPCFAAGIDSNTKLMLHCDGADGSVIFTDVSDSAHNITVSGNAQVDTAQSKFGGASLYLDGAGDFLDCEDSADYDFALNESFTIDFWLRWDTAVGVDDVTGNGYINGWLLYTTTTDWFVYIANAARLQDNVSASADTWYHVAIIRNVDQLELYVNGVGYGAVTYGNAITGAAGDALFIGKDADEANYVAGWIDEYRVSKGIARWTTDFTPPTEAYSAGGNKIYDVTLYDATIYGTGSSTQVADSILYDTTIY